MIRCLIFDCDGTLVDSEPWNYLALQMKLEEIGIEEPIESLSSRFRGKYMGAVLRILESDYGIRFDADFERSYRVLVNDLFDEHLQPCAGVMQLLRDLAVPVCVASSAPAAKIHRALSVTRLSGIIRRSSL